VGTPHFCSFSSHIRTCIPNLYFPLLFEFIILPFFHFLKKNLSQNLPIMLSILHVIASHVFDTSISTSLSFSRYLQHSTIFDNSRWRKVVQKNISGVPMKLKFLLLCGKMKKFYIIHNVWIISNVTDDLRPWSE